MVKRILVLAPNWLGDAVMSLPAIALLRQVYREAHLAVLVREKIKDVFSHNPAINEVIGWCSEGEGRLVSYRRTVRKLKRKNFDLALLFPNSFGSALVVFLARVPYRVGYATDGRSLLLTQRISCTPDVLTKHQADYYRHIVWVLGRGGEILNEVGGPRWEVLEKEKEQAESLLCTYGITPGSFLVGIFPGAAYGPAKTWFPERFARLADCLIDRYQAEIILLGNKREKSLCDRIGQMINKKSANLAGETNLRLMAAIVKYCKLVIVNDSGAMHVAAAVGTPLVAIFSSTDPNRTSPRNTVADIIYKKASCSPCLEPVCRRKDYHCLKQIAVEDVLESVSRMVVSEVV